jgi:hypothetical protein
MSGVGEFKRHKASQSPQRLQARDVGSAIEIERPKDRQLLPGGQLVKFKRSCLPGQEIDTAQI